MKKTIMLFVGCFAFLAIGDSYYTVDGIEYEYGYSEDRANAIAFDNPNTVVPASVSLPIYDWNGNIEGWMTYRVVSTRECICPPEDLLLKSLVFDGDIEVIGDFSFAESANLKSVSMKNVELISWAAFCDCSNLSTVEWGDVKTIGGYAFSGCSKLKTWSWPSQCHVLDAAFSGTGIEQVRIPADVEFGTHVLDNCKSLTSAVFETGVTVVPDGIFAGCSQLADIELPNGISRIGYQAFQQCECLKEIQLPETIQEIGDDAFHSNKALVNINIPNSLSKIGAGAFALTALTNVDLSYQSIDRIADRTFHLCSDLKSIKLPPSVKEIGDEAFSHSAITNGDFSGLQITNIGESAFAFCDNLANLVLPETLQSLGYRAIYEAGGNCNPLRAMLAECETYQEMQKVIESQEYKDALKAELANPTVGTVEFRGPPPQMEDSVFCFEDKCISANFYVRGKYSPKYAVLWRAAIAEWDATHGTTNEWHGLQFKADIVVEPTDWKLEAGGKQTLTISWHFPTNETYTIDKATADLKAQGKKYKIYRGKDDEKFWDDFSKKECIVESTSDLSYPDEAFGDIKGTHPVRYWVEVIGEGAMNTPEPVHCDTRRRFGLAVGLSVYDPSIFTSGDTGEMCFPPSNWLPSCVNDANAFAAMLTAQGGTVRTLINSQATMGDISSSIKKLPFEENGKKRFVPGDIAFLWISTHGVTQGGIRAYDGYYLSGTRTFPEEKKPQSTTFQNDLAWVREFPGVRFVGLLPICHAKHLANPFSNLPNVAWICAAKENEEAADWGNSSQFATYFLNHGFKKGIADQVVLEGDLLQPDDEYGACLTIGNANAYLDLGEMARYGRALSYGGSSIKPAHTVLVNENVLNSISMSSDRISSLPGKAPGKIKVVAREDEETGTIRLYVSNKANAATDLLIGFREIGADCWQWSSKRTFGSDRVPIEAWALKEKFWALWKDFSGSLEYYYIFGSQSKKERENRGIIKANTEYEFAVQAVNEYGYGQIYMVKESCKTGATLPTEPKEVYERELKTPVQYAGILNYSDQVCGMMVEAQSSGASVGVSATIRTETGDVCYYGEARTADINSDGEIQVLCVKNHTSAFAASKQLDSTLADNLPSQIELRLSIDCVCSRSDGYSIECTPVDEFEWGEDDDDERAISVDDEYGPFIPGEKVELKFPEGAAWKVTGLPTGLKWDAKLPGVTGVPTKPGSNTVYFTWTDKTVTPNVTHKASSTFIVGPLPKASVQIDGKGKVTGAGAHLAGKKVTLKATAGKGYAFAGWYLGGELVTKSASYSFKATGEDADYRARFVTLAEDKASIKATVNGMQFSSTSGQETASPLSTNAMCGVALFWPLSHEALSATSVKVTGLPKGLKYDTKKKAIAGTPTAPGKTSSVKVAVTTAGKQKATFVLKVTVDPLPEWARGQFAGTVDGNALTMTVGSTGKVSGKFKDGITNWTFSASSFATNSVTVGETNLLCRATAKGTYKNAKKKTVTVSAPIAFELVARPDVSPIAAEGLGDFADATDNVEIWRVAGVRISVGEAGGGTVKMDKSYGQVASNKTVKLTATLKKGYTLLGWYDEVTGELLSQKTSFSLVSDGVTDRFVEARFAKESDLSASDFTLDWDGLTNLTVGVAYSAKLTVSGAAAVKIASVSGLPKGLTWKSGKVSGVPTVAKSYTVTAKVVLTTNSKKVWKLELPIEVRALPGWAAQTFEGNLGTEDEPVPVTVTIGSSGKVSGKYTLDGAKWTFSSSSLSSAVCDEATGEPSAFTANVTASATISKKKKSQKLVVTVTEEGVDIQAP